MYGIVLLGMPCSGKSTIGKLLATNHNYYYISSGDIARRMAREDVGVQHDLSIGRLAPEAKMRNAIGDNILRCKRYDNNFILDGFPRFLEQDEWLRRMFPNTTLIRVYVHVEEPEAIRRGVERGREDDKSIFERIDYYNENTYQLTRNVDIIIDNNGERRDAELANHLYLEVLKSVDNCKV